MVWPLFLLRYKIVSYCLHRSEGYWVSDVRWRNFCPFGVHRKEAFSQSVIHFHRTGHFVRYDVLQKDTFQEILHHFSQDAPSDVPANAWFGKFYIKLPAFSYPFGPEKAFFRNFYIGFWFIWDPLGFLKNCVQFVYIGWKVIDHPMYC